MSRPPDFENNPYEKAEDSLEKIEEDLEELMTEYFSRGAVSRPGFAEQLLTVAQQYEEFAKYTEGDREEHEESKKLEDWLSDKEEVQIITSEEMKQEFLDRTGLSEEEAPVYTPEEVANDE